MTNLITAMVFSSLVTNWETIATQQPKLDSTFAITAGYEIQLMTVHSNTYALFDWDNKPVKLLIESVPVRVEPEVLRRKVATPMSLTNWFGNPWLLQTPTNFIVTTNDILLITP